MRRAAAFAAALILPLVAASSSSPAEPAPFSRGITTAIYMGPEGIGPESRLAFARVKGAGARVVRLGVAWRSMVPGPDFPTGFRASDPGDPRYKWQRLDMMVKNAVAQGLQPMISFWDPPRWGRLPDGAEYLAVGAPALDDYVAFATALARRYSGGYQGLPRVRYWMAWNEPNAIFYWAPQYRARRPVSPTYYRTLLNAFSKVMHRERADNVVVAGALSPFTRDKPQTMAPLTFMRSLLCVSAGRRPRLTCNEKATFDVWSHHPYTSGGPTHSAYSPHDVSLGDLAEMKDVLDAAVRLGRIESTRRVPFWVTEFSWDTSPPDPRAVPARLHARWTAEAVYRMWEAGVSLVTWLELRDSPYPSTDIQSGLYYRGKTVRQDRPKLSLRAYEFPFVAFARPGAIDYWGRVPPGKGRRVVIERSGRDGWRQIAIDRADASGIVRGTARSTSRLGHVRARVGSITAVPFSLRVPPDRPVTPFGTG